MAQTWLHNRWKTIFNKSETHFKRMEILRVEKSSKVLPVLQLYKLQICMITQLSWLPYPLWTKCTLFDKNRFRFHWTASSCLTTTPHFRKTNAMVTTNWPISILKTCILQYQRHGLEWHSYVATYNQVKYGKFRPLRVNTLVRISGFWSLLHEFSSQKDVS